MHNDTYDVGQIRTDLLTKKAVFLKFLDASISRNMNGTDDVENNFYPKFSTQFYLAPFVGAPLKLLSTL